MSNFALTPIGQREVRPSLFNFNFGSGSKSSKKKKSLPLTEESRKRVQNKKTSEADKQNHAKNDDELPSLVVVNSSSPVAGTSTSTSKERNFNNSKKKSNSKRNSVYEERKKTAGKTNTTSESKLALSQNGVSLRSKKQRQSNSSSIELKNRQRKRDGDDSSSSDTDECGTTEDSESERNLTRNKMPTRRSYRKQGRRLKISDSEPDKDSLPSSPKKSKTPKTSKLSSNDTINPQREIDSADIGIFQDSTSGAAQEPPSPHSFEEENEEDDSSDIEIVIEENYEEYKKLRNSSFTNNKLLLSKSQVKEVAGFMEPKFTPDNSVQECSGVDRTLGVHETGDSVSFGYIRIRGRTVRPPEASGDGKLIYWIINGTITVKSAGGYYKGAQNGETNYLFGKELSDGVCIVIPKGTVYTFENRKETDALLSYCLIRKSDDETISDN